MRCSKHVKKKTKEYARMMRRLPTIWERKLWARLCRRQCGGFRFWRQAIIYGFVADFYCAKCKLAIELDGRHHLGTIDYDTMRSAKIATTGIKVIRFWNSDIDRDIDAVVESIRAHCEEAIKTTACGT